MIFVILIYSFLFRVYLARKPEGTHSDEASLVILKYLKSHVHQILKRIYHCDGLSIRITSYVKLVIKTRFELNSIKLI